MAWETEAERIRARDRIEAITAARLAVAPTEAVKAEISRLQAAMRELDGVNDQQIEANWDRLRKMRRL